MGKEKLFLNHCNFTGIQLTLFNSNINISKYSVIYRVHSLDTLHSPLMLVDKTNFGLVIYNHTSFYPFEEPSSYWSVKQI